MSLNDWTDNQPGWQDRLRAELDEVGLSQAKRWIAERRYRKVALDVANQRVAAHDADAKQAYELELLRVARQAKDISTWSLDVALVAAFIAFLALVYKV